MPKRWKYLILLFLSMGCLLSLVNFHNVYDIRIYTPASSNENKTSTLHSVRNEIKQEEDLAPERHLFSAVHPSKPTESFLRTEMPSTVAPNPIKNILLLSSVGRSGSSFMGELIASQGNNIYFYEPIRALHKSFQKENVILDELLRYFHCEIRPILLDTGKTPFVSVRHPSIFGKRRPAVKMKAVVETCHQERLRIIKTIRTRLEWTRKLLDDASLDLKVIHLVRDPRGTAASMDDLDWKMTTEDMCDKVASDLHEKTLIEKDYPGRYYQIKYEDFCLDPYGKTNEIFQFLRGDSNSTSGTQGNSTLDGHQSTTSLIDRSSYPDIPESVFKYLESHIHINIFSKKSPWTTTRDSSSHYQKWRQKIREKELLDVEAKCQEVLDILGHRSFVSIQNVRNLSIPLFKGD